MSKCLCYKCHHSVIRGWERNSRANDQMLFALYIYCKETKTGIVDDEQFDKSLFLTEQLLEMTCNRFKEKSEPIPFKGEISPKLIKEVEEEVKKQKSNNT